VATRPFQVVKEENFPSNDASPFLPSFSDNIPEDTRRVDRCRVESSKYDSKCWARVISPLGGRIDPATGV
jgi:hypothetical protein